MIQVEIRFGEYRVDADPKAKAQINTAIDGDSGKEFVTSVKLPMVLVETGKQVIKMNSDALSAFSVKDFVRDKGLNYISHRVV